MTNFKTWNFFKCKTNHEGCTTHETRIAAADDDEDAAAFAADDDGYGAAPDDDDGDDNYDVDDDNPAAGNVAAAESYVAVDDDDNESAAVVAGPGTRILEDVEGEHSSAAALMSIPIVGLLSANVKTHKHTIMT